MAYLTGSVDDLSRVFLALILDNFAKCVFNSWIIALDKMSVDELDR